MPALLGLIAVAGAVLFWVLRAHNTVRAVKELNQDTKGLQRRVKHGVQDIFGTPLQRVRDPRLAAVILMIQLVRTGSPVTASEKTQIMELMEDPLKIEDISSMFERAWRYTEARMPFSVVSDQLQPLLQRSLTKEECGDMVDMLTKVANAYGSASELQKEGITRLKRRLVGPSAKAARRRAEGA